MTPMTDAEPDPCSPFVFSTLELERRAGSMRRVQRDIPAPSGFGTDMIVVPVDSTLRLEARLESVVEGVVFTGVVQARVQGECGRCLREINDDLAVDVCELYAFPDSATDQSTDADEVSRLRDERIDAEPVIRDAVLLALPVTPLCQQDCPGLCADCGEHLDQLPADHHHPGSDIRWAALQELLESRTGDTAGGAAPGSTVLSPSGEQEN